MDGQLDRQTRVLLDVAVLYDAVIVTVMWQCCMMQCTVNVAVLHDAVHC